METNGRKYAAVPGKIPGTPINLGGIDFVMPPLNLDQVQQFESVLPTLGKQKTLLANINEGLPLLHAALSRNYPDLTLDDLRPLLDLGNFPTACEALVESSGYVESVPGEPRPPAR